MSVKIRPEEGLIIGSNTLHSSGGSQVVAVPPEIVDALRIEAGTVMQIEGDMDRREIRLIPQD